MGALLICKMNEWIGSINSYILIEKNKKIQLSCTSVKINLGKWGD